MKLSEFGSKLHWKEKKRNLIGQTHFGEEMHLVIGALIEFHWAISFVSEKRSAIGQLILVTQIHFVTENRWVKCLVT